MTNVYLEETYGKGIYQKILLSLVSIFPLVSGYYFQTTVYDGYVPEFTCNLTNVPFDEVTWFHNPDDEEPSSLQCFYATPAMMTRKKCPQFLYDQSVMRENYVTEYDLVCDREYLLKWLDTIYLLFQCLAWLWAIISDKIGRRPVIFGLIFAQVLFSIILLCVNNLIVIFISRAVLGSASMLTYIGFLYIMEMVPDSKRYLTNIYWFTWSVGYTLTTAVAYFSRTSFYINLWLLAIFLLYIPLLVLLKESPKWLFTRNRMAESVRIIGEIGKINKINFQGDKEKIGSLSQEKILADSERVEESLVRYFLQPKLSLYSLVLAITYLIMVSSYYVTSNSGDFVSKNIFFNTLIQGILELPTAFTSTWICAKFKRRPSNLTLMVIFSILILINGILFEYHYVRMVTGIICKFILTNVLCTYSFVIGEITPISLHGSGFFAVITISHLFSAFSSFLYRTEIRPIVINTVFSVLYAFLGSLSYFILPETKDLETILTISDAKKLKREKCFGK